MHAYIFIHPMELKEPVNHPIFILVSLHCESLQLTSLLSFMFTLFGVFISVDNVYVFTFFSFVVMSGCLSILCNYIENKEAN